MNRGSEDPGYALARIPGMQLKYIFSLTFNLIFCVPGNGEAVIRDPGTPGLNRDSEDPGYALARIPGTQSIVISSAMPECRPALSAYGYKKRSGPRPDRRAIFSRGVNRRRK